MKKIVLIFIVIFLTGCKAEVNININANEISENIKIYDFKENVYDFNSNMNQELSRNIHIFEHEYEHYDKEEFEIDGYVGKIYKFTSDLSYLNTISRLRTCYEDIKVYKNSYTLTINTSDEYRCGYIFGANDVVLNIISDLKVSNHNADRVDDNKYIWNINSENYKNKPISISYDLNPEINEENENNEDIKESEDDTTNENTYFTYSIVSIIIIILILSLYVYVKIKNSNK